MGGEHGKRIYGVFLREREKTAKTSSIQAFRGVRAPRLQCLINPVLAWPGYRPGDKRIYFSFLASALSLEYGSV
jgi:hypothetical protein